MPKKVDSQRKKIPFIPFLLGDCNKGLWPYLAYPHIISKNKIKISVSPCFIYLKNKPIKDNLQH